MSSRALLVSLVSALIPGLGAACVSADDPSEATDHAGELAVSPVSSGYAPLVVSLTFDDGHDEHVRAAEWLAGIPSTFYVSSGRLGDPGGLTIDDLDRIAAAGHEIGAHTRHHVHLPALAGDEALAEMCDDRDSLSALGHVVSTFAYPFGDDSQQVRELARICGFDGARDVGGLRNSDPWAGNTGYCGTVASSQSRPAAERLPPVDRFAIRSRASIRSTCTHDDLRHMVLAAASDSADVAVREPRWLVLNFHRICSDCEGDAYAVTPRRLQQLIIWLRARQGAIPVLDAGGRVIARRPLVFATVAAAL